MSESLAAEDAHVRLFFLNIVLNHSIELRDSEEADSQLEDEGRNWGTNWLRLHPKGEFWF